MLSGFISGRASRRPANLSDEGAGDRRSEKQEQGRDLRFTLRSLMGPPSIPTCPRPSIGDGGAIRGSGPGSIAILGESVLVFGSLSLLVFDVSMTIDGPSIRRRDPARYF